MKLLRPKSLVQLIFAGFILVVLPLILALLYAVIAVDKLAAQNQQTVSHAVMATRGSHMLIEQISLMERNLRQYQILGDEALREVYEENRYRFLDTLGQLGMLDLPDELSQKLNDLAGREYDLYANLRVSSFQLDSLLVSSEFNALDGNAQDILVQSRQLIDSEVKRTQAAAVSSQQKLVWAAVGLVLLTVVLAVASLIVISKPLRQMDESIRRLGGGDFKTKVELSGPRDIEQLGGRLDWMRTRLLEAEEDKLRFLRHISHELKTPLTSIREGTELMREGISGELNSQQGEIVELLYDNSIQLQKLIEDLLNFNTVSAKGTVLNLQPVRLDEVVADAIQKYKASVMARNLKFVTKLGQVTILGDREKLRTVIDNLLSNAVKYSPDMGCIRVGVNAKSGYAVLDVLDEGPGIPHEQQRLIFKAFYQGSVQHTGHVKGSGIGLSIVKEYVHAHGGRVAVMNKVKRGAHMRVALPVKRKAA